MIQRLATAILIAASAFAASSVYDFTLKSIDGQPAPLAQYKGKVLLIVNVASQCGFTPQYKGLEAMYEAYKSRGLVIVGVPANNFMNQEPGTDQEIKSFCTRKYNVTFPMMSKVSVKGDDQTPLYRYLTGAAGSVGWNFTKFLIGKDGTVIRKFDSAVSPDDAELKSAVEKALAR